MTERRDGRDGPAFGTGPEGWREKAAASGPGPESSGGTMRRDVVRQICEEVIAGKDTENQATLAGKGVALAVILPEVLDELERTEAENGRLTRDVGGAVGRVLEDMEQLIRERDRLKAAIVTHRNQKADDRCVADDDRLYEALGDNVRCDRRVGDKAAMLANCARFIDRRCEGGGWPSYAELEAERDRFKAGLEMVAQIIHGSTRQTKAIADAVLGGADPDDPRFIEVF